MNYCVLFCDPHWGLIIFFIFNHLIFHDISDLGINLEKEQTQTVNALWTHTDIIRPIFDLS